MSDPIMPYTPYGGAPAPRSSAASYPGALSPLPLAEARERAIRLLSDGYAYDALTEEEFEWRLGQLNRAMTAEGIDALVADLIAPPAVQSRPGSHPVLVPEEGRIAAIMGDTRRDGQWTVPRLLRVRAVMSSVRLDFRNALIPEQCTVDVSAIMSNVAIIVPPEMSVDMDVSAVLSNARNSANLGPAYGAPRIRIVGSAIMAEVRARARR
jgi:hypothetical protein